MIVPNGEIFLWMLFSLQNGRAQRMLGIQAGCSFFAYEILFFVL
jgi:hypothetical protein